MKLNALNEKCDLSLIETNEREQIAEIIILTGNKMGYNDVDEDITEGGKNDTSRCFSYFTLPISQYFVAPVISCN